MTRAEFLKEAVFLPRPRTLAATETVKITRAISGLRGQRVILDAELEHRKYLPRRNKVPLHLNRPHSGSAPAPASSDRSTPR